MDGARKTCPEARQRGRCLRLSTEARERFDLQCLALFGEQSERHRLLAEHLTSEYRVRTTGRGRTVDEWKQRPERPDNHWFDCLVGCAVAASIQGAVLFGTEALTARSRERVSFAQLQQRRHG